MLFAFVHLRITSNIWLSHMLRWLIAIIVNHPFLWEKENENRKFLSNGHLLFLKYLPFVFAVCQIQPFRAAVVAQKSIQAFYFMATVKFQANLFPPKQQSKMFGGTTNYCWRTFSACGMFWHCHFDFLSIILLTPVLTWCYITFFFSLPCFSPFLQLLLHTVFACIGVWFVIMSQLSRVQNWYTAVPLRNQDVAL